eukprot:2898917-Rhodomonas_salina.1
MSPSMRAGDRSARSLSIMVRADGVGRAQVDHLKEWIAARVETVQNNAAGQVRWLVSREGAIVPSERASEDTRCDAMGACV